MYKKGKTLYNLKQHSVKISEVIKLSFNKMPCVCNFKNIPPAADKLRS